MRKEREELKQGKETCKLVNQSNKIENKNEVNPWKHL